MEVALDRMQVDSLLVVFSRFFFLQTPCSHVSVHGRAFPQSSFLGVGRGRGWGVSIARRTQRPPRKTSLVQHSAQEASSWPALDAVGPVRFGNLVLCVFLVSKVGHPSRFRALTWCFSLWEQSVLSLWSLSSQMLAPFILSSN